MEWAWYTISLQQVELFSLSILVTKIKYGGYSPAWSLGKTEMQILARY